LFHSVSSCFILVLVRALLLLETGMKQEEAE